MVIYTNPKYITVSYDSTHDVIIFDWNDFMIPLADIEELHAKALNVARQRNCYYFIAETSKVQTALRREVIEWFGDVWVPTLVEAGLQAIVTVLPSSTIASLSTDQWQTEVIGGITMKNVKSLQEAIAFVGKLRQEASDKV